MIPPGGIIHGHPADDLPCNLWHFETLPPASFGDGPWPSVALFPPGTFHNSNPGACLSVARALAAVGYRCWSCTYRVVTPANFVDGQTTDGTFPQCFTDGEVALAALRADPLTLGGRCGVGGGSTGASIAAWLCFVSALRPDFGFGFSGAHQFDERRAEPYTIKGGQDPITFFRNDVNDFFGFPDDNPPTLPTENAGSITTLINGIAAPFFMMFSEMDNMPFHQYTDMKEALIALGVNAPHWIADYWIGGAEHAFNNYPHFEQALLAFMADPTGVGSNGEPPPPPPPPPDQIPTGFVIRLVSIEPPETDAAFAEATPDATGRLVLPVSARTDVMTVSQPCHGVLGILAFNAFGDGPETFANFMTPGDVSGLKSQPRGTYALPSAPGGIWGDLTGAPFWDIARLAGMRARVNWAILEPTKGAFDLSPLNDPDPAIGLIALAQSKGKGIGLSITAGLGSPADVETDGAKYFDLHAPDSGHMPFIWDPVYIARHRQMALYTGGQLDSEATIKYLVASGPGQIVELYFVKTGEDFNIANGQAVADGFVELKDAWIFGAKQLIQNWVDGWPTTPILLSLGMPFPSNVGGQSAIVELVTWAALTFGPGRVGFMQAGLNTNSNDGYFANALIKQYSPTQPTGFQFTSVSTNDKIDPGGLIPDPGTRFTTTMDNGLALLWKFAELYVPDATSADPIYTNKIDSNNTAMALLP